MFQADLDGILTHIDKLNELDTSGVEPMAQVLYDADETATLREDVEAADRSTTPRRVAQRAAGRRRLLQSAAGDRTLTAWTSPR